MKNQKTTEDFQARASIDPTRPEERSYTNTSAKYALVGDHRKVIGAYSTPAAAAAAAWRDIPVLDDSRWSCLHVVSPGETITGRYSPA